jgi:DNA-binding transcriptional ArsR family regulator
LPQLLPAHRLGTDRALNWVGRATRQMPFEQHPIYVLKADFFRALGHPARVRILELISEEERAVGELQAELGLDSSGTSQHLAALRRQGLVETRRQGTTIFYKLKDPRVAQLLKVAREILTANLAETRELLDGLREPPREAAAKRRSR